MEHIHSHAGHLFMEMIESLDPWSWAGMFAVLSFSFMTSLHCAVMCGPLVCGRLGSRAQVTSMGIWLYNFGRMLSYVLCGALLAGVGAALGSWYAAAGELLACTFAMILFWQGGRLLLGMSRTSGASFLGRKAGSILQIAAKKIAVAPIVLADFSLGFMTVLLPCMTLSPALIAAAATGDARSGAAVMFGFFVGTLPVMMLVPAVTGVIIQSGGARSLSRVGGLFLMLAGAVTLARVFHGHGS